ncbi:MAG TPA: S8 family serine peptidase [Planctomycetota bacterium]
MTPSATTFLAAVILACGLAAPSAASEVPGDEPRQPRFAVEHLAGGYQLQWRRADGGSTMVATGESAAAMRRVLERGPVVALSWHALEGERFAVSLDGGRTFGRARDASFELLLRYAEFDPLRDGAPEIPLELSAPPDGELWIVQYVTKGVEPWREEIRALGGIDHRYLAQHANIWRMSPELARAVEALPFVRWVGPMQPAYKLENELMDAFRQRTLETARYHVVVGEWGPLEKAVVARRIEALGGTIDLANAEGWVLDATLDAGQLLQVAAMPEVLGVDRWSAPESDMNIVRSKMGADYVEVQGGYTGNGVRAEVMDGNLNTGLAAWKFAPILHGSRSGDDSHGTSTYSINFADTATSTRGMAPDAQGIFADYGFLTNRYTHTQELVQSPYFAVYQSNSWGGGRTTQYNSTSQQMDDVIYLNDIIITQSQSNAGNQDSRPEAWAKNVVSVGGIRHYNDTNDANDDWNFGGSTGPAADGRVKPDLAAYYDSVVTVNNSGFGGTSAASPIVAGHFALFFEMWHAGIFGNTPGATVFDSRPHSTLAKAMMIHNAYQYPSGQTDITRFRQGWGRPDLTTMYDRRDDFFWIDESDVLRDQESTSYSVDVASGAPDFRATLVYIDRAGTTSSTQHRINDLSLKVTSPGGTIYWGNNGLTSGAYNWSSAGGSSNTKDTVENVFVQSPVAGTWTVEVIADEVNMDTHPENGSSPVDADYALVVSPVSDPGGCGTVNTISLSGPSQGVPGASIVLNYANATPNSPFWILYSPNLSGSVLGGHCFDIGNPVKIGGTGTTNATGAGSWVSPPVPAAASGRRFYLEMGVRDSFGNVTDSNAIPVDVL